MNIGNIEVSNDHPFVGIFGPCQIESPQHAIKMALSIRHICQKHNVPFIYKSSFDKANRTSHTSKRGVGMMEGLAILETIRELGIPVTTDVHETNQVNTVAKHVDMIQIPAFLCRQTDLLLAAGDTGKPINVKKGQFLSPKDMQHVVRKIESTGNCNIIVTERGTTFGYNNLVVDMRSLLILRDMEYPVVFDATHSTQFPGGHNDSSGGDRRFALPLARAAIAVGVAAIFAEVHDEPDNAPSDGPSMLRLDTLDQFLEQLTALDRIIKDVQR